MTITTQQILQKMPVITLAMGFFLTASCNSGNNPASITNTDIDASNAVVTGNEVNTITRSLVVLGDSVAAGEGINYGYTYDTESVLGARWIGGINNPVWQGPYQLCHDSMQAYGEVVASELNLQLFKFACTGATYGNGLIAQREHKDTVYRPAEFGNWQTQTDLNPEYDKAKPDVVVLTFGADDVDFVGVVTYCVLGFLYNDMQKIEAGIHATTHPRTFLKETLLQHYPNVTSFLNKKKKPGQSTPHSSVCTAANPGKTIEKLFWDPINNGTLTQHYVDMVNSIKARGTKAGKVPKIIFTNYHNPLPTSEESIDCHDLLDLNRANVNYINTLQAKLNETISDAVSNLDGVEIVDLSHVMDGHRWCSDDPWTYGLSILWLNRKSQAPFHPTPAGQKAIANLVKQKI